MHGLDGIPAQNQLSALIMSKSRIIFVDNIVYKIGLLWRHPNILNILFCKFQVALQHCDGG